MKQASSSRSNWLRLLMPVVLILTALGVIQSARVIGAVNQLMEDARALPALTGQDAASLDALLASDDLGAWMAQTEQDFRNARAVLGPLADALPLLGGLPRYGGDLANAPALLDFGEQVTAGGQKTLSIAHAFNRALEAERAPDVTLGAALLQVSQAQAPQVRAAQQNLTRALQARAQLEVASLSPARRDLVNRLDRWLPLWQTTLDALALMPTWLGADKPRLYLLVAQNSDELRATGGFVSTVALVRVERGRITLEEFQDSYAVDDLTKRHPIPPEPLYKYMYAWQWMLRDANWSPDFPTTARQLQTLYQFDRGVTTDGVIALNQNLIPRVLQATGPIGLEAYNERVDADNAIAKIRQYWVSPWGEGRPEQWWVHRKDFIGKFMQALMQRLLAGQFDRAQLARGVLDALTTKDLLIYVSDGSPAHPTGFTFGGALYPGSADAFMLVDSNVGFNKVNVNIAQRLEYAVVVEPTRQVRSAVTITYTNHSPDDGTFCVHVPRYLAGYTDLQNGCYWNYMRVLVPAESEPVRVKGLPAPMKDIPEQGRAVFGGYFVLPRGKTQAVRFEYRLPLTALAESRYTLHLEKQPGAPPLPTQVRVTLPESWTITYAYPPPERLAGNRAEFALTLDRDRTIEVEFESTASTAPMGAVAGAVAGAAALAVAAWWVGRRRRAAARSR